MTYTRREGVRASQADLTNVYRVRMIGNGAHPLLCSLTSSGQAPVHKYWETIMNDYIATGKFDVSFLVTHRVPIEDMAQLYYKYQERVAGVEKVFVTTKFSAPPATNKGFPTETRVADWPSK